MISFLYKSCVILLFLVSIPLQFLISLIIILTSGFPILFTQQRIGKDGKPFVLYKFRTMRIGAEKLQKTLLNQNEADGPVFKIHNDPRFTSIGRFFSHTGLDELPQLWNVLMGDMNIIGPRPLPVYEEKLLSKKQKERRALKPGIISPWVLDGYHRKPFAQWMNSDIEYTKRKSIRYDLKLCFRMIPYLVHLFLSEI